jgi:hypothetical protein
MPFFKMAWKIKVKFGGKDLVKEYTSPDIRYKNPGWGDEIFNKPIESLEFYLPTGHRIVLSGMERYNFFVEAIQNMGGGKVDIKAFWFLGKYPNQNIVDAWRVEEGKVVRSKVPFGREWGGGPTSGWKQGVVGKQPIAACVEGY